MYETPRTKEVDYSGDDVVVVPRLYEEPRPSAACVALRCEASYETVFGTFMDPQQQKLASEAVLEALQQAGINLEGISSIEFEAGSIIIRVEADEATRAAIARVIGSGQLSLRFRPSTRRGPSRETAWQPQDAARFFPWYMPEMSRSEATAALRPGEEGDFLVYTLPSPGQRPRAESVMENPIEDEAPPLPAKATSRVGSLFLGG